MIKKLFPRLALVVLFGYIVLGNGCVHEDFDVAPNLVDSSLWVRNTTIAQLKSLYGNKTDFVKKLATPAFWQNVVSNGDSSIVIEGYVTSNDSAGNFYEVVTIQDATGGIDVKINAEELYRQFRLKPGQRVLMKVNNLVLGTYHGAYQLGIPVADYIRASNGELQLGINVTGIELSKLSGYMERSGTRRRLTPNEYTIGQLTPAHAQTLVRVNNVQFNNPHIGYSIAGVNTNRILTDCDGNRLILRTSGYASFLNDKVPAGNGSITGILSVYDGTLQLYIRDPRDIQFTNARCDANIPTPNTTIKALKAMCTTSTMQITSNIVVSGVVAANDQSGNLYKQLYIQDETGGINFGVNIAGLYPEYPVGTRIVVNCNGLYLGKYGNVVQLGGLHNGGIGRLEAEPFYSHVFITEASVDVPPIVTTIDRVTDSMVGMLVTLTDVQFTSDALGKTWAEPNATTNRYIEDYIGNRMIVRTSNFADFANTNITANKGSITAILGKYNNDYQLLVRSLRDVRMVEPRVVRNYILSENFSTVSRYSNTFPAGWKNYAQAGKKLWRGNIFNNDSYAEMTAYQSGESNNIAWLITPEVALPSTGTNVLTFISEWHHWVEGTTLEVFASTNYDGTDNVTGATWTKLNARIAAYDDGQYIWVNSGAVGLNAYSGNTIRFAFKYSGSNTLSTGFNIDNVAVINY